MIDENRPDYEQQMNNQTFSGAPTGFETPGVVSAPPGQNYVAFVPYGFTPGTFKEKSEIRKTALMIGLSLIVMLVITLVWGTVFFFVTGRMGISYGDAYKMISDPAVMQVLQVVLSSFMFTIPFLIIYRINGKRASDLVPLVKPEKGIALPMFLFGISFCAFANIAVSQASYFFQSFGIDYNVDYGENPRGFFGFMLSLIATAIVPPLVEEFACRGLILGALRKFGDGFAVLVSAMLFGLMHGNFDQMPFAFLVGLVLGYIVVKTGSLWIAVAVHAFNNFISVFFDYCLGNISGTVQNMIYTIFLTVCLLLGIFAMLLLSKRGETYKFKKSDTESGFGKKMKWFFSSAAIIIFIVVCVLESLLYF